MKHIVISKGTELLRVPSDLLMYISSDGNYSNVFTKDGRSLIINVDHIHFIDVAKQQLILSDCSGSWHELTASREVLIKLKAYLETLIKIEANEKD